MAVSDAHRRRFALLVRAAVDLLGGQSEAARALGLSQSHVSRLLTRSELPAVQQRTLDLVSAKLGYMGLLSWPEGAPWDREEWDDNWLLGAIETLKRAEDRIAAGGVFPEKPARIASMLYQADALLDEQSGRDVVHAAKNLAFDVVSERLYQLAREVLHEEDESKIRELARPLAEEIRKRYA